MKAEANAERGHAHVKTMEYVERGLHPTANVPNGDTEVGGGTSVGVPHALRRNLAEETEKQVRSRLCHTDASELAIMPRAFKLVLPAT